METLDVEQQWRDLRTNYSRMVEGELKVIAEHAYELTDIARRALQSVISERGLAIALTTKPAAVSSELPDAPEPPDDSELISFEWVMDAEELKSIKQKLTIIGTPCYIGPNKVMEAEEYKGGFADGVNVKIRRVDWSRASSGLAQLERETDGEPEEQEEQEEFAVLCPKCRSAEVILEGRDSDKEEPSPNARFNWFCDACGHQWQDDGIEQPI